MKSSFTGLLALAGVALAQQSSISSAYSSVASTATSRTATSSQAVTYTVAVAKGGHTFVPDVVQARPGDTVLFQFYPTNHSVIRADYGYPCVPYELIKGAGYQGFYSGFKPVDAILPDPPSYSLLINDTAPIFYYCGAPGSCIGYGMVGVINPSANTSLAKQKQLAQGSTYVLLPGENWPSEGSPSAAASSSAASAIASSTAVASPASTTTAAAASGGGISGGAIGGIAIGAAAILLAAGVAIWFCGRSSRRHSKRLAPVQEVGEVPIVSPQTYGKHMSSTSYNMPPGYDQPLRSPIMNRTPEPQMDYYGSPVMHNPMGSPNMGHSSPVPAYGPNYAGNAYAVGTHRVGAPIEMSGDAAHTHMAPRPSTEKDGVERYS